MTERVTSVRLNEEVDEWRKRECDNFSALVNRLVTQYKDGGQDESVIRNYREQEIEAKMKEAKTMYEIQKEMLEDIRAAPSIDAENYQTELEDMGMVAPNPDNPPIQQLADEYDKDAQTVAEDIAEMYDKEVKDEHEFDY